jgi:hypothetical protein
MPIYITDEELILHQAEQIDVEEAEIEAAFKSIEREREAIELADEDWADRNGFIIPEKPYGEIL